MDYSKFSTKTLEELNGFNGDYSKLSTQALQEIDAQAATQQAKDAPIGLGSGEAASRGAAQGFTFGLSDELGGAIREPIGAAKKALNYLGGNFHDTDVANYERERNTQRQLDEAAQKEHGTSYMVGDLAGAVANPLPGRAVGAGIKAVAPAARALVPISQAGASVPQYLTSLGKAGVAAGGEGALRGLGHSEANTTGDLLADTGIGAGSEAVLGMAGKGAGDLLGKGAGAVGSKLEDAAGRRAFKAIGRPNDKVLENAERQGGIEEIGRYLQDKGIVSAGKKQPEITQAILKEKSTVGKNIGGFLTKADEIIAKAPPEVRKNFMVSGDAVIDRAVNEILPDLEANIANPEIYEKLVKKISDFESRYKGKHLSLSEANKLKSQYDKTIFDLGRAPENGTFKDELKKFRGIINDEIETKADQFGNSIGGQDFREKFKALKDQYGVLSTAGGIAKKETRRNFINRLYSPSDYGMGAAAGIATGGLNGVVAGAAAAEGNKLLRTRGNQVSAALLRRLSRAPQAFGKFAPLLQDAARRGTMELVDTHNQLLKDPEYQQLLQGE